jgi:hypothetical protein
MVFSFSVASCAIHPLPEDYSGVSTKDIVRQIRCEARKSLIDMALNFLSRGDGNNESSRLIAEQFRSGSRSISEFSPKLFKGFQKASLDTFWTTGIAYNFNLDMTEVNNLNASVGFSQPFATGVFGLGGRTGVDRSRGNVRTFTVTDTFERLFKLPENFCANKIVGPNYIYPITGEIGMSEPLQTFVYLSLFGGLTQPGDPENPPYSNDGPPTMVEALQFTTKLSGSVTPSVVFTPIPKVFSLVSADLNAEASRTDIHKVTIGLALDKAAVTQLGAFRDGLFARYGGQAGTNRAGGLTAANKYSGAMFGRLLTASGSRSEIAAAEAVDQYLTQRLFSPTINFNP